MESSDVPTSLGIPEAGGRHDDQNCVVDIGINLTNKAFRKNWKAVVRRAVDAGVHRILLTGTSIQSSRDSLRLAHEWYDEEGTPNLCVTVGVHPHDAKSWNNDETPATGGVGGGNATANNGTLRQMRELLKDPLAVAVGECGLDFNRNFSSKSDQLHAFREQVRLARDLNYPIFVHEREAHNDLLRVLDDVRAATNDDSEHRPFPKIVIHCFTGTKEEAQAYIQRGFYIGFTGTICKKERGAHLRDLLPSLPLDKIMVETDAPYMGFKKTNDRKNKRPSSEPVDCIDVAKQLSESVHRPFEEVCRRTTQTATEFFRLP